MLNSGAIKLSDEQVVIIQKAAHVCSVCSKEVDIMDADTFGVYSSPIIAPLDRRLGSMAFTVFCEVCFVGIADVIRDKISDLEKEGA